MIGFPFAARQAERQSSSMKLIKDTMSTVTNHCTTRPDRWYAAQAVHP
jgi:hypothetical protein